MKEHGADNDQTAAVLAAFIMLKGDVEITPAHVEQAKSSLKKALMFLKVESGEKLKWENGDAFIRRVVKARTYREGFRRLNAYMDETDRWSTAGSFLDEEAKYIEWWRRKKAEKRKAAGKKGAAKKWKN